MCIHVSADLELSALIPHTNWVSSITEKQLLGETQLYWLMTALVSFGKCSGSLGWVSLNWWLIVVFTPTEINHKSVWIMFLFFKWLFDSVHSLVIIVRTEVVFLRKVDWPIFILTLYYFLWLIYHIMPNLIMSTILKIIMFPTLWICSFKRITINIMIANVTISLMLVS